MNRIKTQYLKLPLDKPCLTLFLSCIVVCFLAIGISWIRIDDDFVKMFPDDIKSKVVWDQVQEEFGSTEHLVVAFGYKNKSLLSDKKAYKDLSSLVEEYEKANHLIDKVVSINNRFSIDGNSGKEKKSLLDYDTYTRKKFTNAEETYVAIYIVPQVGINNSDLVKEVKKIAKENLDGYDVHFAGQPYLTGETPNLISEDIKILMMIGIFVMLIILGINLKSIYAVFSVLVTILLSLFGTIGFMGWMYNITSYDIYNFTILSTSMPIILLTIANSDGVHVLARFRKEVRKNNNVKEAIRISLEKLRIPIFLTSITTAIAFLSMIFSPIPHMIGYGIVISFGVIWAWILSTTLLPSLIVIKNWNLDSKTFSQDSFIEKIVKTLSQIVTGNPKKMLIGSFLVVAISFIGIWFVKVEVNVIKFFKEETNIRKSTDFIDDKMNGSMSLIVQAEGDFTQLENIQSLDSLQTYINENFTDVRRSMSYSNVLKEIMRKDQLSYEGTVDSDSLYRLPDDQAHLRELFDFTINPSFKDTVEFNNKIASLIDVSPQNYKQKALLLHQMKTVSTQEASDIANQINNKIDKIESTNSQVKFSVTGLLIFLKEFVSMVVESALTSIIVSILIIALIMFIFFRKIHWSILSVVPLLTAVILNFGIMGLIGVELSHLTALLTSIIIGVGVDFSIHYISDYRNKIKNNIPVSRRNLEASQDVGYPIMLDVASNLGFVALLFSAIIPLNYMGALMVFAMISTSFGALIILSSILELMKERIVN